MDCDCEFSFFFLIDHFNHTHNKEQTFNAPADECEGLSFLHPPNSRACIHAGLASFGAAPLAAPGPPRLETHTLHLELAGLGSQDPARRSSGRTCAMPAKSGDEFGTAGFRFPANARSEHTLEIRCVRFNWFECHLP